MPPFLRVLTITAARPDIERHLPAHLDYLRRLAGEGVLRLAGPFRDGTGGVEILEARDRLHAERIVSEDPFVRARLGVVELREFRDLMPELGAAPP